MKTRQLLVERRVVIPMCTISLNEAKYFLTAIMLFMTVLGWGQNKHIFEKVKDTAVILPVEINFGKIETKEAHQYAEAKITFNESDFESVEKGKLSDYLFLKNEKQKIYKKGSSIWAVFYLIVKKEIEVKNRSLIKIEATFDSKTQTKELEIIKGYNVPLLLDDYMNDNDIKLDNVSFVESENNILTLHGFKDNIADTKSIQLKQGEVYALYDQKYAIFKGGFNFIDSFSLVTVPFKVRPKNENRGVRSTAQGDFTNLGLNMDIARIKLDRYFSDGKKSTHKLSLGFWAGPSIEELDSTSTKGYLGHDEKTKQLFISTGITISYTYNDISLLFVPVGWDIPTSTTGKNWDYGGKRWWGFGIGVNPKIFSTILNK